MKILRNVVIITFIVSGLIFARTGKNVERVENKNLTVKGHHHYWVKDYSNNDNDDQLDRKRSHKRRRKIRKPVKGLR